MSHYTSLRSAFPWDAYKNRSRGLSQLRNNRIHVDTLIETYDGFSDTVHWQALIALCPDVLVASISSPITGLSQTIKLKKSSLRFLLPTDINGSLAIKLIECAYGEQIQLTKALLNEFYLLCYRYNIDYGIEMCLNFASTLVNINNCISCLNLSIRHSNYRLGRASYFEIRSKFKLIVLTSKDFHLLPVDCFRELLEDNLLMLDEDEELAWLAIIRWTSSTAIPRSQLITLYRSMIEPCTENLCKNSRVVPEARHGAAASIKDTLTHINPDNYLGLINLPTTLTETETFVKHQEDQVIKRGVNAIRTVQDASDNVREKNILELMKCIRFLRFRSINAFRIIASQNFIRNSEKLRQLVEYMKIRFIFYKKLNVDQSYLEQVLTESQLKMIKRDETSRYERTRNTLAKLLRFEPMTTGCLPVPLYGNNEGTSDILECEYDATVALDESTLQFFDEASLIRARTPRVPSSIVLLFGGWKEGTVSDSILSYDFVCDKWFKLNVRLPEPRAFHTSCRSTKSGNIFIFGGTDGEQILDSAIMFNPEVDICSRPKCKPGLRVQCRVCNGRTKSHHKLAYRFHCLASMNERRCHLSGVFHSDGKVYALGGHNGQQRLRSGEWYNEIENRWIPIADMTIARSDAAACSHENKIYIAGGQIGDQYIQASVEFYKSSDDTWTFATPMIVPRMAFKLVSYKSQLFAIGGANSLMGGDDMGSVTRTVERYDVGLSSWFLGAPMLQKRSSFGAICLEKGRILVVGGHSGRHRLKSSEMLKIDRLVPTEEARTRLIQSPNPSRSDREPSGELRELMQSEPARAEVEPLEMRPLLGRFHSLRDSLANPIRGTMKWVERARLPKRRSGFSMAAVGPPMSLAWELSYHGSRKQHDSPNQARIIKGKGRWHKLKFIRRRKLIKNLKIALIITVIIIIM